MDFGNMDLFLLPSPTCNTSPLVQANPRHTYFHNAPQDYISKRFLPGDLYRVVEEDSDLDDFPITIAPSPVSLRHDGHYSMLDIPSPTSWPTHNHHKIIESQHLSPAMLSKPIQLAGIKLEMVDEPSIHSHTQAPSLDGSIISDDMATASCPPTPDLSIIEEDLQSWTIPAQLDPSAMLTLGRLAHCSQPEEQAILTTSLEMQEKAAGNMKNSLFTITTDIEIPMSPINAGELSAISIPSPGGLCARLAPGFESLWSRGDDFDPLPQTSVAEGFYGLPFAKSSIPSRLDESSDLPVQVCDGNLTQSSRRFRSMPAHWACGMPGLQALKSPVPTEEQLGYNESYERRLKDMSCSNIDRTATWLSLQAGFIPPHSETEQETTHCVGAQPVTRPTADPKPKDSLFIDGFKHVQTVKGSFDAFVHRKARIDKLRLDRKCLFSEHVKQLQGEYSAKEPVTAIRVPGQCLSLEEQEKAIIQTAQREQHALAQLEPVAWNVEATKFLNGGTLLTSPSAESFKARRGGRILDLGGFASCDWSWQVALEYPDVTVYTVCTKDQATNKDMATPNNHKQSVVPNLWTLPFPSQHFDCISARNLYTHLKTDKPKGRRSDEYDLCLQECMRLLRPGGYLEFNLLDADIMNPGPHASKTALEFSLNLSLRGYDPAPTKTWLTRLRKAGFANIRRAWMVLPMSQYHANQQGTTADASHITGMVGSWAWERWMLKLNREMISDNAQATPPTPALIDAIAMVLDEGSRTSAGWRCLSGWARKPACLI